MLLSNLSIKRPYFAFMANMLLIIFGILAFQKLPISNQPNVDIPYIWIYIDCPSASPSSEEELILKPLEEVLKNVPGMKSMHVLLKQGVCIYLSNSI